MKWINLVIGGIAGTIARYLLSGFVYSIMGTEFPYGTLMVNLSACLLIGFLNALAEDKFLLGPDSRILWMAGFCGAYSTFSTFILETSNLVRDGENMRALVNLSASVFLGFILFRIGALIGRII